MSEKTKNILLGVLIVGLVSMTVAYAALSQTLNINGSAKVQGSTSWNVHFTTEDDSTKDAIELINYAKLTTAGSTISLAATQVTTPDVTLSAPGDKVEFRFDVINEGKINAELSALPTNVSAAGILTGYTVNYTTAPSGTSEEIAAANAVLTALQNDIVVKLTYADGTAITAGDKLYNADDTDITHFKRRDLLLTIEYVQRETNQELPTSEVTISGIASSLIYVQETN